MLAVLMSAAIAVYSEVPIQEPVLGGNPTGIAPLYFGPNAFPIPDMLDGRTATMLRAELAADGYLGREKDWTADIFARIECGNHIRNARRVCDHVGHVTDHRRSRRQR